MKDQEIRDFEDMPKTLGKGIAHLKLSIWEAAEC